MIGQVRKTILLVNFDNKLIETVQPILCDYSLLESGTLKASPDRPEMKNIDLVIVESAESFAETEKTSDFKNVPVLYICDNEKNRLSHTKSLQNAEDYISKPVKPDELKLKVQVLLRRSEIYKTFGSSIEFDRHYQEETNKVLLVDDDPQLSKLFGYNLNKAGFEVKVANGAAQALELLKEFEPDIIVCDIMMPEIDGYELRRILLQNPALKAIPFVFLTAKGEEQDILTGYDLEIEDYIIKTSGPRVVVAKVSAILKSHEKERKKIVSEIHRAADSLRAKVVPDVPPAFGGFDIEQWHLPFKGIPGGDFIDYFQLDDHHLAIILGDVMGKKWGAWYFAFAYAGYIRSAIRVAIQSASFFSPALLLQKINESIYHDAKISEVFATLSILILDKTTNTARYAGAGDLPVVYKEKDSGSVGHKHSEGLLLGFAHDGSFSDVEIKLKKGDCLYLLTDGIIESRNYGGEQFGENRFIEFVRASDNSTGHLTMLKEELTKFTGGNFEDDISLISVVTL